MKAIILLAHGSRDPQWVKPIESIAQAVAQQNAAVKVRCAYIELMQPSLADATADLAAQGAVHIRIAPLFLGIGKHVREDLPRLTAALRAAHPTLEFELMPSIGEHPALIACIANILSA